jgi:polar amino acid transport system substrate-binding protein
MNALWGAFLWSLAAATISVAPAQTLDRIAATKVVRIGFVAGQAPFASKSASGSPEGYSIDLCNALVGSISATVGELQPEYFETTLSEVFDAVAKGHLDLACGAITITLARRELVDFSEPIFVTGASAILRKDSPRDLRELFLGERTVSPPRSLELRPFARSRIGVRGDTTTEAALRQAVSAGGYTADVVTFATHADGLRALEGRDIDAYVADRALLAGMLIGSGNPSGIVLADRRLTNEFYGIAIQRGDSDFRLLVDRFLSTFYAEPEFPAVLTKHFGGHAAAVKDQIQSQAILE